MNDEKERDTGVEPVSQPWEGWAQPIYQSRTEDDSTGNSKRYQGASGWVYLASRGSRRRAALFMQ